MSIQRATFPTGNEGIETPHLLDTYRRGPDRLTSALEGLDAADLDFRARSGKWTIREIVVHADAYIAELGG